MINLFGTSQDMVIQPVSENGRECLLAIDDQGLYLTTRTYAGKRTADPNRYSSARRNMPERLKALNLDAAAIAQVNKHRIPRLTEADTRKINPLKASKRAMKKA